MPVNAVAEIELKSRKIQVELPPRSAKRLDDLKELIEASTTTEVFKAALRVLEEIALRYEQGDELLLKQKDGDNYPVSPVQNVTLVLGELMGRSGRCPTFSSPLAYAISLAPPGPTNRDSAAGET